MLYEYIFIIKYIVQVANNLTNIFFPPSIATFGYDQSVVSLNLSNLGVDTNCITSKKI